MKTEWITQLNKQFDHRSSGLITVKDDLGHSIKLEWKVSDITSPELGAFKRTVCEVANETLAAIEVEFLKAYPKAVQEELFLKSCEPFFKEGLDNVDWDAVERQIQATIKQFYNMDLSKFGKEVIRPLLDDIYFFVTAKESETNKIVGFLMCSITPALAQGNVKAINLWVAPDAMDCDIPKMLIESILEVIDGVSRIYLLCRPTNIPYLEAYRACDFKEDPNFNQDPNHIVNLEYFIPLQKLVP